jgi:hypothetical protein
MSAEPPRRAYGAPHARRRAKQAWRAAFASMIAAFVAWLAAAPVRAEPGPRRARVRLELTRGPGTERCPDEQFLRAETARHMGFDPFDAEAPLTMAASIGHEQGELAAAIFLRDRGGRVLWADGYSTRGDCTTLVAAMGLSIAAQLSDPGERPPPAAPAARERPATSAEASCSPERPCAGQPAPSKAAPARAQPPVRAPPRSGAGQAAAERFRWTVGAGATMALGLTPGVAVGPALSVAGRWPSWSVALEARGLASLSTKVTRAEDVRVTISVLTANAAVCLHRHFLFACGVGELGVLRSVPEVPLNPEPLLDLRAGIGARAGVTWSFSESLSGYGYTEVVQRLVDWSLLRHKSIAESERTVWSAPAVGVAFGMGLQLNL